MAQKAPFICLTTLYSGQKICIRDDEDEIRRTGFIVFCSNSRFTGVGGGRILRAPLQHVPINAKLNICDFTKYLIVPNIKHIN